MAEPLVTQTVSEESEDRGNPEAFHCRLEDCWDEPIPHLDGVPTDLKSLQGAWVSVTGRREAKFLFSGNRFTVHFKDGEIYMGIFAVDSTARPKTMDMVIEEGPGRHKGETALCIYDLRGEMLHWCAAGPGRSERLPYFPADDDRRYLEIVFRRE